MDRDYLDQRNTFLRKLYFFMYIVPICANIILAIISEFFVRYFLSNWGIGIADFHTLAPSNIFSYSYVSMLVTLCIMIPVFIISMGWSKGYISYFLRRTVYQYVPVGDKSEPIKMELSDCINLKKNLKIQSKNLNSLIIILHIIFLLFLICLFLYPAPGTSFGNQVTNQFLFNLFFVTCLANIFLLVIMCGMYFPFSMNASERTNIDTFKMVIYVTGMIIFILAFYFLILSMSKKSFIFHIIQYIFSKCEWFSSLESYLVIGACATFMIAINFLLMYYYYKKMLSD